MPWTYSQTERQLTDPDGKIAGQGYSGHDAGYNNHTMQDQKDVGPTPVGTYTIGPAFRHALAGPVTMRLTPSADTDVFGRDGFMIHGDTADHATNPTAQNSASHGCIVLARPLRDAIAASTDRTIVVTI
ncbi:MAG: tlde1 domain-containing protein [Rhodospirillales bacterium]